jgi:hypothetical protein
MCRRRVSAQAGPEDRGSASSGISGKSRGRPFRAGMDACQARVFRLLLFIRNSIPASRDHNGTRRQKQVPQKHSLYEPLPCFSAPSPRVRDSSRPPLRAASSARVVPLDGPEKRGPTSRCLRGPCGAANPDRRAALGRPAPGPHSGRRCGEAEIVGGGTLGPRPHSETSKAGSEQ